DDRFFIPHRQVHGAPPLPVELRASLSSPRQWGGLRRQRVWPEVDMLHSELASAVSLDHIICSDEETLRHGHTECFRRLEVDHQLKIWWAVVPEGRPASRPGEYDWHRSPTAGTAREYRLRTTSTRPRRWPRAKHRLPACGSARQSR